MRSLNLKNYINVLSQSTESFHDLKLPPFERCDVPKSSSYFAYVSFREYMSLP